jgi:DNA primase
MGIKPQTLEKIKAASLSKVVEAMGGGLKKIGYEYVTQCPWHEDSNPSLTISDRKGFCFCHVCREGGDAIDYVQKKKGLTWREACEVAAGILGIEVETDDANPEEVARRREEKKRALQNLKSENKRYVANLHDKRANRIRQIIKERGLTKESAVEFELGFAPAGFFAGRITIPIYNHLNELVGWTGRATGDQPGKYKNTSDNDLFHKKQLVFNEYRATDAAKEAGSLIFVEGHLDVVSMWQHGIRNVVAMQGTAAPDPSVLQRLARNVKNFVLCYDGDAGGRKAVEQFLSVAQQLALKGEININVVTLPAGKDPDEVLRGGEDLYRYIAEAPSWLDWVIDEWVAHMDIDDGAMVTNVEQKLKQLINGLRSKALRAHYIDRAARALATNDKEAEKLAKGWETNGYESLPEVSWQPRSVTSTRIAAERRMVRIYVHCPHQREALRPMMSAVTNPAVKWLCQRFEELEEFCVSDLTPHSIMAIVATAEPHYMNQLRTLVRPNVIIDDRPGVISHLADILLSDTLSFDPNS